MINHDAAARTTPMHHFGPWRGAAPCRMVPAWTVSSRSAASARLSA